MVCYPATQFGCGFTLTFGVKFILVLHLLLCITFVFTATAFLVFGMTAMNMSGSYAGEIILLAFFLSGVPIILLGFNGVLHKNEPTVNVYLMYLRVSLIIGLFPIVQEFVFSSPCSHMPKMMQGEGQAWACGMARWTNIIVVVMALAVMAYFQHVVWSFSDDLISGGGPDLCDLQYSSTAFYQKPASVYDSVEGFQAAIAEGLVPTGNNNLYAAPVGDGLGGGQTIFGNKLGAFKLSTSRG